MRTPAPLLAFLLVAGTSTVALADRQPPRPEEAEDKAEEKTEVEEKTEQKAEDKAEDKKSADDKKAADDKSGSCSISQEDDAMFGAAALLLLLSGVGLRRTRRSR